MNLDSDTTGRDFHHGGEILEVVATAALEADGLGNHHVGFAAGLALGEDLGRFALTLGVSALVSVFLEAGAFGGFVDVNLGQISRVEIINRVALFSLHLQTTAEQPAFASRAALTSVQLIQSIKER